MPPLPIPRSDLLVRGARVAALALPLVLVACARPEPVAEPVRAVKLVTVAAQPLGLAHEYAGEVRARVESRLGFRVAGKIVAREVELGQRVQAGQVLARIDERDYQLAADAARAQLSAALTQRDQAAADLRRFQALRDQNFISGAELERRESVLKAAQAQVEQAQSQLAAQTNQASYTRLVADRPGVVTAIEAEPGQVVAAGTPVVRIAQDAARDVAFAVPEDKVQALKPGATVQVRAWATGNSVAARVREVAAAADPVTRTYQVRAELPAAPDWPLGATVYVRPDALAAQGQLAIKLPTSALRQQGGGSAVWVYDPAAGVVRSRPVLVATADGNDAVIAEGLTPGVQVVAAGVHVLQEGQAVRVWQQDVAKAHSASAQSATNTIANAGSSGVHPMQSRGPVSQPR